MSKGLTVTTAAMPVYGSTVAWSGPCNWGYSRHNPLVPPRVKSIGNSGSTTATTIPRIAVSLSPAPNWTAASTNARTATGNMTRP